MDFSEITQRCECNRASCGGIKQEALVPITGTQFQQTSKHSRCSSSLALTTPPIYPRTQASECTIIITRNSEVMFSPCVFVCVCLSVCLSVYVCHDVCPDDLTMKDWCHTNDILQVHCWRCLVVQVIFHALLTSLMTSQGHQVGQIFKLIYFRQYLS